jgi:putative ABC transport system permease protein
MNIVESIRMAARSLTSNKLRSTLTMLGIIIGTGAVIALLSLGQGAQVAITSQIQGIGSNLFFIIPGANRVGGGVRLAETPRSLTREDAVALRNSSQVVHVAGVAPVINRTVNVTAGSESSSVLLTATTTDYEFVRTHSTVLGNYFSDSDDATGARVAVLGWDTAERLFGDAGLALGQTIRVNRIPFRVVGVLERKGGQGFQGRPADEIMIVPLTTAQTRLFSARAVGTSGRPVDQIYVSAIDERSIDIAIDEVTWLMRERRNIQFEEDDFTIVSQEDILGALSQITSILTIFLGAIAGISLLVGGIGIMNIMLVSVTERTREIGVRKAVGARRSDILLQFLIESVVLSILGGLIGIAFGWGVSALVNRLGTFVTVVSPDSVALAVGFSLLVGLFFGSYPANRAAGLQPVDALRYE